MKSILTSIAVIFSVVVLTSSCNDDKESSPSNPIVGTWVLETITMSGCDDDDENGNFSLGCTATTCSKVTTTKDGKFSSSTTLGGITVNDNGTYAVSGNSLEICVDNGTDCSTTQFQLSNSNNNLTMKETDEETGCLTTAVYKRG